MKSILKKNQIIITALAIMICVAGYLNFTKDKTEVPMEQAAGTENEVFTLMDGNDIYADISDEDLLGVADNQSLVVNENTTAAEEASGDPAQQTETAAVDGAEETAASEDGVSTPGEAILASTTLNGSYFSSAKLTREQIRAKNKETLMSLIADTNVTEEQKQAAIDSIIEMTATAEKENAAEILLEAKGFDGAVVSIIDGTVDVVVNSETITDAQVAQIEDIVTRKTGAEVKDIVITSVIVQE